MIRNICFHGIGACRNEREPGEARYWVGEPVFLGILDELQGRSDVRISFDDGNRSDHDIALPALTERGLTASFFVLAGRLEDAASLNARDLGDLLAAGMRVGSHGWRHIPWRRLDADDARREFRDARRELERVSGVRIEQAALPLGMYDRRTLRALRNAGYRTVYTSDRFPARADSWLQARYSVTATDTVDSVRAVVEQRPGPREAGRVLKSMLKRMR